MFVKGLEECNIILEIKDSSTFGNYSLSESSNELNIVVDYHYYEACNIDIKAYLENYPSIKLETTIRVIIPSLGVPILTNDKQYYNLIADNYLDPITHKIEFSNIFKNTQDVENLTINITNISLPDSFGYSENMIYSYIKPSYRQNNTINIQNDNTNLNENININLNLYNSSCNEIGPYYVGDDNNNYNIVYIFKYDESTNTDGLNTTYNITFDEDHTNVDLLVVGGGGGGGIGLDLYGAGGGGTGGILHNSNIILHKNVEYQITVGNGGNGDADGYDSMFYLDDGNYALAKGGGKGGSHNSAPGSGGGGSGNPDYKNGGLITDYNCNIGDFSILNSYQNVGNDADINYLISYIVFNYDEYDEIEFVESQLFVDGNVSILRWIKSHNVIISTGNWSKEQKGLAAINQDFTWNDTTNYLTKYSTSDEEHSGCWGFKLTQNISYTLNEILYDKHFILNKKESPIELTTIAYKSRSSSGNLDRDKGWLPNYFKIFGTNFDTSNITLDNIKTNNWTELVEIKLKNNYNFVSLNKDKIHNLDAQEYTDEDIGNNFHKYTWTNTNEKFNTFLFMVISNNQSDLTADKEVVNVAQLVFRGVEKTMIDSTGGDGSSSDLIYLKPPLNFDGGIGKSNIDITSFENGLDDTGSGGSGNGGKGGSGIVLLKYNTGHKYYPDEYYCNLLPLYQELTVDVENIFGSNTATLRFININKFNSLAIADISNPNYKIDITTDNIICNINSDFEIIYRNQNISNISKDNQDLVITNDQRGLYYDVIINDSNYNYVYRIEESGDLAKPILTNNDNYFNLVSNSIIEYPNIFKNTYSYDLSEITIYEITTYQNAFTIDKNKLIPVSDIETRLFSASNVVNIEIKASNLYQNNTETLTFFKIDDSLSNIKDLTNPTQTIEFKPTDIYCNILIGEDFNIIFDYSNINNEYVIKDDYNLIISNIGRLITYDVVIKLINTNHSYIYCIEESLPFTGPILRNSDIYFNLITNSIIDETTHKIEFNNIFKNNNGINDDIEIIYVSDLDKFSYSNNMIYSYIKPDSSDSLSSDSYYSNIFTEESPYYTEITIKASNLGGESFEETLRFIKLGYDTLTASNIDIPSYEINLTDNYLNYPINNLYNVLYSPLYPNDYKIIDSNLLIINKYRNETFDIILTIDSEYQYIYRITEESGTNNILLTKSSNYKYIIDETEATANHKIIFDNIFRHKFFIDNSPITITNVSIPNTFDIESNSIFGYLPENTSSIYQLSNLFLSGNTEQTVDITASNLYGYSVTESLTFIKGFDSTSIIITETIDTRIQNVLDIGDIELVIPSTTTEETVNIETSYLSEDDFSLPVVSDPTTITIDDIILSTVETITIASKIIQLTRSSNIPGVLEIEVKTETGEIDPNSIYAIFTYDDSVNKWIQTEESFYNPETNTVQVNLEDSLDLKYAIFEIKPKTIRTPILEWMNVGWQKPTIGTEIINSLLTEALKTKTTFTIEEYTSFNTDNLKITNYIKSNNNYFKPKLVIIGNPPILKESSLYYYLVDTTSEQDYSNIFTVTNITDDANIKISSIDRTDVFTILDNNIHSYSISNLFLENEYFTEMNIKASNLDGETEETLRFLRLGYTTLTVPNLINENVSNIYLLEDEVSYEVGKTFSIEYNPIESGCNLEIDNCNLIINDDYRGIYDTIIGLGEYIVNIFRINEREDNTIDNTYSV
jgi:hypothetical protein